MQCCRNCGESIRRKRQPGGRLENSEDYRRRRYCSRRCFYASRADEAAFPLQPWMHEYLAAFDRYLRSELAVDRAAMSRALNQKGSSG